MKQHKVVDASGDRLFTWTDEGRFVCPVCADFGRVGPEEGQAPDYYLCPTCMFEFGVDDSQGPAGVTRDELIARYRMLWLQHVGWGAEFVDHMDARLGISRQQLDDQRDAAESDGAWQEYLKMRRVRLARNLRWTGWNNQSAVTDPNIAVYATSIEELKSLAPRADSETRVSGSCPPGTRVMEPESVAERVRCTTTEFEWFIDSGVPLVVYAMRGIWLTRIDKGRVGADDLDLGEIVVPESSAEMVSASGFFPLGRGQHAGMVLVPVDGQMPMVSVSLRAGRTLPELQLPKGRFWVIRESFKNEPRNRQRIEAVLAGDTDGFACVTVEEGMTITV